MARDKFDKELEKRMHSAQMQPDDAIWNRIESSLDVAIIHAPMSNRRKIMRIAATITSVAAVILLSLLLINNEQEPIKEVVALSMPEPTKTTLNEPIVTMISPVEFKEVEDKEEVVYVSLPQGIPNTNAILDEEPQEEKQPQQATRKTRSANVNQNAQQSNAQQSNSQPFIAKQTSKKRDWMMSVSGSGNFSSSSSSTGNNTLVRPFKVINPNNSMSLFSAKDRDREWKHNMPLAVSVTVQKMFNKRFGLETGLTYTYLSSSSKGESILDQDIKQQLNYLGIPLSVVYSIAEGKRFGVYAKGGFLLDKAIASTGTSRIGDTSQSIDIDTKGVQLSATLQVGASYNLTNYMSLYLEPTANYYFKSNQPISYRTENDFGFTAMVGLRFRIR